MATVHRFGPQWVTDYAFYYGGRRHARSHRSRKQRLSEGDQLLYKIVAETIRVFNRG